MVVVVVKVVLVDRGGGRKRSGPRLGGGPRCRHPGWRLDSGKKKQVF